MTTLSYILYLLGLVTLFAGVLVWVLARKRKPQFEEDARIPLHE